MRVAQAKEVVAATLYHRRRKNRPGALERVMADLDQWSRDRPGIELDWIVEALKREEASSSLEATVAAHG